MPCSEKNIYVNTLKIQVVAGRIQRLAYIKPQM